MDERARISDFLDIGDGPVLVHSDALNTLRLVPRTRDICKLAQAHINKISHLAGGRNLWMPAFNYSFPRTHRYDLENDSSEVGLISEQFRESATWRTHTPIFNFTGTGVKPGIELFDEATVDPFGPDSAFGDLIKFDGSILWYGAPIASATILHFVESHNSKPLYRYDKIFSGTVINGAKKINVHLKYHVRPLQGPLGYDWPRLTQDALESSVISKIKLDAEADIFACSAGALADYWAERYSEDPFYFLDAPSRKWTEPLLETLGRRFNIQDFEETN